MEKSNNPDLESQGTLWKTDGKILRARGDGELQENWYSLDTAGQLYRTHNGNESIHKYELKPDKILASERKAQSAPPSEELWQLIIIAKWRVNFL